jgi:hypothetical protein
MDKVGTYEFYSSIGSKLGEIVAMTETEAVILFSTIYDKPFGYIVLVDEQKWVEA